MIDRKFIFHRDIAIALETHIEYIVTANINRRYVSALIRRSGEGKRGGNCVGYASNICTCFALTIPVSQLLIDRQLRFREEGEEFRKRSPEESK